MFGFKKNKPDKQSPASTLPGEQSPPVKESNPQAAEASKKTGLFARLKSGLSRTRGGLTSGLADLVLGKKAIDDEVLDEIETLLLTSDVGVEATQEINYLQTPTPSSEDNWQIWWELFFGE